MRARTYRRSILLWGILVFSSCGWGTAQGPGNSLTIRVESSLVLVPVHLLGGPLSLFPANELHTFGKSLRLLVDGKQQKIQSVDTVIPTDNGVRRDNLGAHFEWADFPGGIWSSSDVEPGRYARFRFFDYYLIAFSPPPSPKGSCHRIQIKARRYQSLLVYRHEYCNVPHASWDPLRGTPEGNRLKRDIASGQKGSIPLSAEASYVYAAPGEARVQIDMEFPFSDALPEDSVLIIAYQQNGEAMARRSDHWITNGFKREWWERAIAFAPLWVPTRYETQMELPPGDYRIAIAFSRGSSFGVTEVPLTIRSYDPKQLSISSIALCKRVRKAGVYPPVAAKFVPLVSKGYEFTPAADTVFQKYNSLMAYFEVYEPAFGGTQRSAVSVHFDMRIINEKSGAVVLNKVLSAASYRVPGKAAIPIAVEPVLHELHLTPGKYEFEIQAFDSVGRKTPWEAAEFSYK